MALIKMTRDKSPSLAVDVLIEMNGRLVLIKRKDEPFKGSWAIPGGFVEHGETVEEAARREAEEETGLKVELTDIIGVFSEPDRDPRGHIISICFGAKRQGGDLRPASDAADVKVFKEVPWSNLAFDHGKILKKAKSEGVMNGILS